MVAGARTFGLEDTFLEPQILNPPPTRHALLAFLLVLAAIVHIGTAGWGALYDGVEGQLAGGAREMLESKQWLVPTNNGVPQLQTPPLAYWALALSYKIFGMTATAARIPIALAMVGSVALIFLIGERLAGYWRGFAAGLIHLCSGGAFLLARMVVPESFFALFITGAIYCLVCGYQHRKFRWAWFAGFWLCATLGCLSKGPGAILYLAGVCLLLAVFFREARMRFRLLLHWSYLLLFLLVTVPWFIWAQNYFPGSFGSVFTSMSGTGLPRWQFLLLHFAWWFPAIFLILPGLLLAPRKIIRPHEFTFAEALPFCWLAIAVIPILLMRNLHASSALSAAPAFALFAACAWERTSHPFRSAGIALVFLAGVALAAMACFTPSVLISIIGSALPAAAWPSFRSMAQMAIVALIVFSLPALFFVIKHREEIALFLILSSMVPIGFCLAECVARAAPLFSMVDAAHFLNPRLGQQGQVLYEGPLKNANSLSFYLNKKFFLVNQTPGPFEHDAAAQDKYLDEHFVLEAWEGAHPIYLIVEQERVAHWRRLIIDRVHIYRQVTTCGTRVVLSNEL
jgi:4-amino-4-deoxy-L-arabinose transferase-like glycosyltransferase